MTRRIFYECVICEDVRSRYEAESSSFICWPCDGDLKLVNLDDLHAEVGRLREERDHQKLQRKGHADTLRGIATMSVDEGDRMKLWARDGLSGYVGTIESGLKDQQDTILEQHAENAKLRATMAGLIADRGQEIIVKRIRELEVALSGRTKKITELRDRLRARFDNETAYESALKDVRKSVDAALGAPSPMGEERG